ncbi:hypothetical protein [Dactylosporangium sp. NPDC051484]|uniref:hypothetical protein n=1 Tax=Dactylosporangium sp. NPDC051484 TaxID=3154942 RepID=UPI00344E0F53
MRAEVRMWSGSPQQRRFVAVYHDDGRAVGALGWNDPRGLRDAARTLSAPETARRV